MANLRHLQILGRGVEKWNAWRLKHPSITPNLEGMRLVESDLSGINLKGAKLADAYLFRSVLRGAKLRSANLERSTFDQVTLDHADLTDADASAAKFYDTDLNMATLRRADLTNAMCIGVRFGSANLVESSFSGVFVDFGNFEKANLKRADLSGASLIKAKFRDADLTGADLSHASLNEADLTGATLAGCRVYGVSAWNLDLEGSKQSGLIITRQSEPAIQVDDLEIAQFIYLLLNNAKIRNVIDTLTSKVVLILGRFTGQRKAVLDALWRALRTRGFVPVIFDFTKPRNRTTIETISTLANMAKFVIADVTDAKSVLQELQAIVDRNTSIDIQPILLASQQESGMFDSFKACPWVLPTVYYRSQRVLLAKLDQDVLGPLQHRAQQKNQQP